MATASSEPSESTLPDTHLCQVIENELSAVKKTRSDLMTGAAHPGIHLGVLILCVGINVWYFLFRYDYITLFIAASFYLNMFYFIILLIPLNIRASSAMQGLDLSRFRRWLQEIGLKSGTARFTKLFVNSLFINSRTLSLGISLIFTIDILLAVRAHTALQLPFWTTIIVISQCATIVAFYLLVWKLEPFTTRYGRRVEKVKRLLINEKISPRVISGLFIIGFLIAIGLFLTTIILLPGITLHAFLNQSQLTEIGNLFSLIAVLAISQYFIIRFIHGFTSRAMAERLFDHKDHELSDLQNTVGCGNHSPDSRAETMTRLLETKIYTVRRNTLYGFFPVYVVDIDFSVILDSTTGTAIRGYIGDAKAG